jgi:hypothetical protein
MVKSLGILNANGRGVVTLDAGPYDSVTAVVTNADWSQSAFSGSDWVWSKNHQAYTLKATTADPNEPAAAAPPSFTPCPPTDPEPTPTPTPTATATPSATATPTPTPTVRPPVATTIRLSRSSTRIPSVLRKGVLSLFAQANKAGRYTAKATVDAKTAKRLKVGRRTTSAGTGRRTATAPARLKVNVKLTRKLRAALKRNRKRSVKFSVAVTFVPADGTSAVRKAITIKLKP